MQCGSSSSSATHVQQAAAAAATTIIDGRLQLLSLLLPIDGKWRQKSTLIDNSIASVCVLVCASVCECVCLRFLCRKANLIDFHFLLLKRFSLHLCHRLLLLLPAPDDLLQQMLQAHALRLAGASGNVLSSPK